LAFRTRSAYSLLAKLCWTPSDIRRCDNSPQPLPCPPSNDSVAFRERCWLLTWGVRLSYLRLTQIPDLWGHLIIELDEYVLTRNGTQEFLHGGAFKLVDWITDRIEGAQWSTRLLQARTACAPQRDEPSLQKLLRP